MNARKRRTRQTWKKSIRQRPTALGGLEILEARQLMAQLEIRLDALALDGTTPITSLNQGQQFLLRGQAKDLRSPTDPNDPGQGPFQVYTDINYSSAEVLPIVTEVERLTFTGQPNGGSFTLTYEGDTTAAIPFREADQGTTQAQEIQDALNSIPVLSGNVRVEEDISGGSAQHRYLIRFINALQNQDVTDLVADGSNLTTDPTDPDAVADAVITEFAKGERSNLVAFRQAFAYHSRSDAINLVTAQYPDSRLANDKTDLFDNVGGGVPVFSPPGTGFTTYFMLRAKAVSGGADGKLTFVIGPSHESGDATAIYLYGQSDPLPLNQIKFTYGANGASSGSLQIPVNTTINAVDDSGYTRVEDSAGAILSPSPLNNDTQTPASPNTLVITSVSAGSGGGTMSIVNNAKDLRYKPAANFFGTETFNYTISDGKGHTDTAKITIQVTGVNDPPSFVKGADVSVNEDSGVKTITQWATSISDGPGETNQALTFIVNNNNASLFANAPAINAAGTLTFQPALNKSGVATVTVKLKDDGTGSNTSAAQTFTITVNAVNDAPVNAVPGSQSTVATNPLLLQGADAISVNDVDAGTADIFTKLSAVSGTLSVGGTIGAGLVVAGNGSKSVTLTGSQADINAALAAVTYRADAGFTGSDTITVLTNDQGSSGAGGAKSDTDTIAVSVTSPSPPNAIDDSASIDEDSGPKTLFVLANDIPQSQSSATLESFTQPSPGGTVTLDDNNTPNDKTDDRLIFKPALNFNGDATFTYQMNDTQHSKPNSTGMVTVHVAPVNDPPSGVPHQYSMDEDGTLNVAAPGLLLGASDVDGDSPLTALRALNAAHGNAIVNANGSFTYKPSTDYNGNDTFRFRVQDPSGAFSTVRVVTIHIAPKPDAPKALDKTYAAAEDTDLTVPASNGLLVGATDADGDSMQAFRVTQGGKGSVVVRTDGSFTYSPNAGVTGQDTFKYKVVDSTGLASIEHTVTINIGPVNHRPVAQPDPNYTTTKNTDLVVSIDAGVLQNDTDADGNPLTAILVDVPSHGSVTLNSNGSFTYHPATGFVGTDTFTYQAKDNSGAANNTSVKTTVTITVTSTNSAPVAYAKSYTTAEDVNLVVDAANGVLKGATDPDGNQLTAVFVTLPSHGTLVAKNSNGSFTYHPNANFHGTDSFTFQASDGQLKSAVRAATITLTPVNDPPPAVDDFFDVFKNAPDQLLPDVLVNDRAAVNVDGNETLRIVGFNAATVRGGTVQKDADGRLHYSPKVGFVGNDNFTYTVGDGHGGQNQAHVNLNVLASAPSTISGYVYRDRNSTGKRDDGDSGIGGVTVVLQNTDNGTSQTALSLGDGSYRFTGVAAGHYHIAETQPRYLADLDETIGSAGGAKANDLFTLTIPDAGLVAHGYNFGEGNPIVGDQPNSDPPLHLTLQEITASNTNVGALAALSGTQQSWFTTLDSSWNAVDKMTVQLSADSTKLYLTVVVNNVTYWKTITNDPNDSLHFRVMATNNQGFQILRLDGLLDLSTFNHAASSPAAADATFAAY
jgi:VCBS repeat-containing protein